MSDANALIQDDPAPDASPQPFGPFLTPSGGLRVPSTLPQFPALAGRVPTPDDSRSATPEDGAPNASKRRHERPFSLISSTTRTAETRPPVRSLFVSHRRRPSRSQPTSCTSPSPPAARHSFSPSTRPSGPSRPASSRDPTLPSLRLLRLGRLPRAETSSPSLSSASPSRSRRSGRSCTNTSTRGRQQPSWPTSWRTKSRPRLSRPNRQKSSSTRWARSLRNSSAYAGCGTMRSRSGRRTRSCGRRWRGLGGSCWRN
ncbi:RHTO0S10e04038g1_1 [Rhodotorula toruloides]|uniref:RHTO0S10e04038g1_1 n=1 Tax=Rhodotorula toruloides TaxID=5286 RepID=A0A061BDG7_RHOTO|nr:RHTO0S10e04038g1_1 [Rhodotorula toruloides]